MLHAPFMRTCRQVGLMSEACDATVMSQLCNGAGDVADSLAACRLALELLTEKFMKCGTTICIMMSASDVGVHPSVQNHCG
jgi:hypothetical protein